MAKTIDINGQKQEIVPGFLKKIAQKSNIAVARGKQRDSHEAGIILSNENLQSAELGKVYPGRVNYIEQRVLARRSKVVRAIVTLRTQQIAKLPIKIIPKNQEPPRQVSVLKYNATEIERHPAFDESDKVFLQDIYQRLDPKGFKSDKREELKKQVQKFSKEEIDTLKYLEDKQNDFYAKRDKDIKIIEKLLNKPDPYFTGVSSWNGLMQRLIDDILTIDRGFIIKLRDAGGALRGLMVVDGATIKPVVNEFGYIDDEKAYIQDTMMDNDNVYISRKDAVPLIMNPLPDTNWFGYGLSPVDVLYEVVMADIYVDKGLIDLFQKGGSVPEGVLNVTPPPNKDGFVAQLDQEQLEGMQRHLQAVMEGDYTQVPIVSGGKLEWIDFRGSNKDNQYTELAEYLIKKICAVYQVSPQDVGFLDGFKTSDGEVQDEMTQSKGLETIMRLVSDVFTSEILSELRPEEDLKLWFEEQDLGRKKAEFELIQLKLQTQYISVNEARALVDGFSPVAWGDTPIQGVQNWMPEDPNGDPMGGLPPLPGVGGPLGASPGTGTPPGAPPPPGGSQPGEGDMPPLPPVGGAAMLKSIFSEIDTQPENIFKSIFDD